MLPNIEEGESVQDYTNRLGRLLHTMRRDPTRVSPTQGGCWYCWTNEEGDSRFTHEFDAYFHVQCLLNYMIAHPNDEEAKIIAQEFGLSEVRN